MPATLVDSNVLIDVVVRGEPWAAWSIEALIEALDAGPVFVDQIVFAEVSIGYRTAEACQEALAVQGIERVPIPWPAAFLAGRAFAAYRDRGGTKLAPLPDFFIGAHAAVAGLRLLTRDASRYRTYFPTVELIAPE
ncbi:MAG TPA: type II toxin-antitoxin system VapC family toxin [Solirubrobacterales bacterium]|nr:type II toxin-antitoxin system VapC family toxin [Solirubrobacterales bacterium]